MARFFFHIDDGKHLPDLEGVELASPEEAEREAIRGAGAIIRDALWTIGDFKPWQMSVTDQDDKLLLTLRFTADKPAGPLSFKSC